MQIIGDIFADIQESHSIPNKAILTLLSEYQKKPTQFINAFEQCFLKIIKSMLSIKNAPKRAYEIYEKLTDKFFTALHNENAKRETVEKDDIYGTF